MEIRIGWEGLGPGILELQARFGIPPPNLLISIKFLLIKMKRKEKERN